MKERYLEEDFNMFVEQLINSGRLEQKQSGIARLMLDKGYDNLSDKQKYIFDKTIEDHSVTECALCACPVPWSEMFEALDNGGYCNHCQHIKEYMDKE